MYYKLCSWIKEDFQEGLLTKQDLANILSSRCLGDASTPLAINIYNDHHVKEGESKGYASDAIKLGASKFELNLDFTLEETVTLLTP